MKAKEKSEPLKDVVYTEYDVGTANDDDLLAMLTSINELAKLEAIRAGYGQFSVDASKIL